jgi:hypothetical protein
MLMHTFEIYRGNRYIDLRKGELPMVWPAHTLIIARPPQFGARKSSS